MTKIPFEDLPSTNTPLNASNMNQLQDNVEDAIDIVAGDIPTIDSSVSTSSTNPVENQAITNYVDGEITNIDTTLTTISGNLTDYVIFGYATYSNSVTINANQATALSVSLPSVAGYKALACVGGKGNGNTGLLIQQSIVNNGGFNTWVTNVCNDNRTYSSVDFVILYIRDL